MLAKTALLTILNVTCLICIAYAEAVPFDTIKKNFEPSYLTFGGGYDVENNTQFDKQYYEAQLYLHFNWLNIDDKGCFNNAHVKTYFPIRLQVRQYKTNSSPVRNPSYNPGLRAYYWRDSWVTDGENFYYASLGFHHYSNGQSGPHLNNSGAVNTDNGSFSSDYLELSGYMNKGDFWGKLNIRSYLTGLTWEPDQTDRYETFLFEATGKQGFPCLGNKCTAQGTVGYKYGRKYNAAGQSASFSDNLQYTGELIIPVKIKGCALFDWNDLSLYVRWDKGHDYYNINYQNEINKVQVGVVADYF